MAKVRVGEVEGVENPLPLGAEEPFVNKKAFAEEPDFQIVQPVTNPDGSKRFQKVGGLYKKISKKGRDFFSLRIGGLRLLAFPNDRQERAEARA